MTEFYDAEDVPAHEVERRLREQLGEAGQGRGLKESVDAGVRWAATHWAQIVRVVRDLESLAGGGS